MSGLVLKLSPKERILINGVVVENGERRGTMNILTPNARILKLKDAIHPKDAKTPVKRLCYIMQLILSGDVEELEINSEIMKGIEQLKRVFQDSDSRDLLNLTSDYIIKNKIYQALKTLKKLISREARLMSSYKN